MTTCDVDDIADLYARITRPFKATDIEFILEQVQTSGFPLIWTIMAMKWAVWNATERGQAEIGLSDGLAHQLAIGEAFAAWQDWPPAS